MKYLTHLISYKFFPKYTHFTSRKVKCFPGMIFLVSFSACREDLTPTCSSKLCPQFLIVNLLVTTGHIKQFAIPEICPLCLVFDMCYFFLLKSPPLRITLAAVTFSRSRNDALIPKTICKGDLQIRAQNSRLSSLLTNYLLKCKTT